MQIAFLYWFAVALKSGQEWRVDGTAIYYALSIDEITTPVGAYLHQFPELLKVLTFATLGLEAFGPFLLFFPFFTGPVRTGAVLAFMSLHFGIWLMMSIGIFPWISAFCMICFLPGWFWEKALPKLRAALSKQPNVARRLQRTVARLVNAYWLVLRSRLSPEAGVERPSGAWLATDGDNNRLRGRRRDDTATGSTPGAVVAARLWALRGKSPRMSPAPSRTSVEPPMLRSSLVTNAIAFFFLLYIFFWNLTTVSALTMPGGATPLGYFLGLDQSWSMFAPYPPKEDGWYVIPGTLSGGQQVDLMGVTRGDFRLREVSWEKPENVPSTFKNEHWRKYFENIRKAKYADERLYLGRYICREWNARHAGDEQLTTFQITYMLEETVLPGDEPTTPENPPEEVVLWEHDCFA